MIKPTKIRPEAEDGDPTAPVGFPDIPWAGPQPPPALTQTQMNAEDYSMLILHPNKKEHCFNMAFFKMYSELSHPCLSVTRRVSLPSPKQHLLQCMMALLLISTTAVLHDLHH